MNDKDKIREQLSAYLDGELADGDRKKLERELRSNKDLIDELRQLRSLSKMLHALPCEQTNEDFVADVIAQAERRNLIGALTDGHVQEGPKWIRWLASAAVLLIAVGIGVVVTTMLNPTTWSDRLAEQQAVKPSGQLARQVDDLAEPRIGSRSKATEDVESLTDTGIRHAVSRDILSLPPAGREAVVGAMQRPEEPIRDDVLEAAPEPISEGVSETEQSGKVVVEDISEPVLVKKTSGEGGIEITPSVSLAKSEPVEHKALSTDEGLVASAVLPETNAKMIDAVAPAMPTTAAAGRSIPDAEEQDIKDAALVDALAGAYREEIFTNDLPAMQRRVEKVMVANGVVPLAVEYPASGHVAQIEMQKSQGISNYAQLAVRDTRSVQYIAYLTPAQMTNVTGAVQAIRTGEVARPLAKTRRMEQMFSARPAEENLPWQGRTDLPQAAPIERPATDIEVQETDKLQHQWVALQEVNGRLQLRPVHNGVEPSGPTKSAKVTAGARSPGSTVLMAKRAPIGKAKVVSPQSVKDVKRTGKKLRDSVDKDQTQPSQPTFQPLMITINYRPGEAVTVGEQLAVPVSQPASR